MHEREQRRRVDAERGTSAQRGYDSRWRRYARAFLLAHPLCECDDCTREQRVVASTVVDHVIAHRGDPVLFWDQSNWRAMAKPCHDRKTAREDGGFGRERTP